MVLQNFPCICGGQRIPHTEDLLEKHVRAYHSADNVPYATTARAAVKKALQTGCAKCANVYMYGPKDAGKSDVLKPLLTIFGDLGFNWPVGGTNNYPLDGVSVWMASLLEDLRRSTYNLRRYTP